jgi:hypothetical protein
MRHVEVNQLWLQANTAEGIITSIKIPGSGNQVDILTKHVSAHVWGNHIQQLGFRISRYRHHLMPSVFGMGHGAYTWGMTSTDWDQSRCQRRATQKGILTTADDMARARMGITKSGDMVKQ